jgi:hypothetical protein
MESGGSHLVLSCGNLPSDWFANALIDARQPEHGSWLLSVVHKNQVYLGCQACQKHADAICRPKNRWGACKVTGKSIKWSFVTRHAGMQCHRLAVAAFLGQPVVEVPRVTPSAESFRTVLDHKKLGEATDRLSTIAGIVTATRMSWCLGEAVKEIDKERVRHAVVIAIHQDARKGILQLRFVCVCVCVCRREP